MRQINTGSFCVVCKTELVAEISSVALASERDIPIGPASKDYYSTRVSFHCPQCQLNYKALPGRPKAAQEILERLKAEEVAEEKAQWAAGLEEP